MGDNDNMRRSDAQGNPRKRVEWHRPFLEALRRTCNVRVAAQLAGVHKATAYRHRERFPRFAERWDLAVDDAVDTLELEARRRALMGTDKPIFYQGRQVATIREYSDRLLMFLLRAARPEKYRENYDLRRLVDDLSEGKAEASAV